MDKKILENKTVFITGHTDSKAVADFTFIQFRS